MKNENNNIIKQNINKINTIYRTRAKIEHISEPRENTLEVTTVNKIFVLKFLPKNKRTLDCSNANRGNTLTSV